MTITNITTLVGDIFSAITTGLSTYASGLVAGIQAYIHGLIYEGSGENQGYSAAFGFILAMAAVALGVGLTRLVWGFVTSLTARK